MATATMNSYCDGSSLANFNAWAYWMYQQFIAFGWVQTADTGQGTFPATGSAPSAAGYYAIFESGDALSGTSPIYVKMEWWESSSVPYFAVTVGTGGTDGAGNLLAPYTTRFYGGGSGMSFKAYSASTSNLLPCYASGDGGSIRFSMWCQNGTGSPDNYNNVSLIIGRSRDSSGNATGNFTQVWMWCYSDTAFQTVLAPAVGGGTNNMDVSGYFMAPYPETSGSAASWSNGGAVMVAPVMQNVGGLSNPTPDLLVGSSVDFPPGNTATITVYGVAHSYIAAASHAMTSFLNGTPATPLMRYE